MLPSAVDNIPDKKKEREKKTKIIFEIYNKNEKIMLVIKDNCR